MNRPALAAILPTLFDPRHGLLQTAPHAPLLLLALPALARKNGAAQALALAAIAFAPFFFLLHYDFWATSEYGNRFFIETAGATSVGTAWAAEKLLALRRPPVSAP
jgi:hypothetical protein